MMYQMMFSLTTSGVGVSLDDLDLKKFETVRTTVKLPSVLVEKSQHFVDAGWVPNRNALIVAALERFLAELERQEIDRQFASMADDESYNALQEELAEEFAKSDWEALTLADESMP
ncbi:MAG: hypothetical protein KDE34_20340 [Anaerolineales bacterium]|nr:hypothetical protein [Anaerolineales bacterium]